MKTLADLSHNDLRAYISAFEGLQSNCREYSKRFPGITEAFQYIEASVEAPLSEAIAEQQRRISEAFPGLEVGDRIEHRHPAGNTSPDRVRGSVSAEGVVTRVGKISNFGYTSEGPVLFYHDDEGKLGTIVAGARYNTWRKLEK